MKNKVNIPTIGIAEISEYVPTADEEQNILAFEKQAELDIKSRVQSADVHFRWSEFEIARAKKIAEAKGLKYQTYLKSMLKQAMDKDEQELQQG